MARRPKHSADEAEFSALGCVMLDNSAFDRLSDHIRAEDFADPRHRVIWAAMAQLIGKGQQVEPVTVATLLDEQGALQQAGGLEYILGLAEAVATAVNCEHHGRIIANYARKRRILETLRESVRRVEEAGWDELEPVRDSIIGALLEDPLEVVAKPVDIVDAAREAFQEIERRRETKSPIVGIPTGLRDLDDITGGWEDGDLITLGAHSGHGKTLAAVQFAADGARLSGRHSLYISVEVKASRLARRIMANYGRVNAGALKTGIMTDDEAFRLRQGIERIVALKGLMSIVHSAKATVETVHREVRKYLLRRESSGGRLPPLGLVVVDYIQRLWVTERLRSREEEVAHMAKSLKTLADTYHVPVIAAAQLNREANKRANKRPVTADIRESDGIVQDSSVVLFVHRPELWGDEGAQGIAELIVAKARDGETGIARVRFDAAQQRMADLEERYV